MDISRFTPTKVVLGVAVSAVVGFVLGQPATTVASPASSAMSVQPAASQAAPTGGFGGLTRCSMVWRVDVTDAPDGFMESVRVVAGEVPALTGVTVEVTGPDTPDTIDGATVVDVSWDTSEATVAESEAYAFAARAVNTAVVDTGRIVFTKASLELTAQGVRNVFRHEVGHMLGLAHSDVPDAVSTMETSVYRLNVLELRGQSPWTQDTRDILAGLYGGNCSA